MHCAGGRLPDDDVADECRDRAEVTPDGGEVEGGDGEDKAFEWMVLDVISSVSGVFARLVRVEVFDEFDAEEKVT